MKERDRDKLQNPRPEEIKIAEVRPLPRPEVPNPLNFQP